jgi:hypothetical protein
MSAARPAPQHLHILPTLTEVIELPEPVPAFDPADAEAEALPEVTAPAAPETAAASFELPHVVEEQIVQHVLADLQRHAELMLEYRLREALAPVLARLTESLIGELRQERAATLRDVVTRAVSQELARRRFR